MSQPMASGRNSTVQGYPYLAAKSYCSRAADPHFTVNAASDWVYTLTAVLLGNIQVMLAWVMDIHGLPVTGTCNTSWQTS